VVGQPAEGERTQADVEMYRIVYNQVGEREFSDLRKVVRCERRPERREKFAA